MPTPSVLRRFAPAPHQTTGFTLIELVMVIVILGVLAAVGLPKFVDLKSDARSATMAAARSAILTAASLVNAKVMATGMATDGTLRQVDIGNGEMIEVQNGHPACSANGIAKATSTTGAGYVWYMNVPPTQLCTIYPNMGKDSSGSTIYVNNCAVVYDNATGSTWTPVTSGC